MLFEQTKTLSKEEVRRKLEQFNKAGEIARTGIKVVTVASLGLALAETIATYSSAVDLFVLAELPDILIKLANTPVLSMGSASGILVPAWLAVVVLAGLIICGFGAEQGFWDIVIQRRKESGWYEKKRLEKQRRKQARKIEVK